VTAEGGEIGRAQAVQAQACGLEPHTDMNPILLKPSSDTGSQVIINGKVHAQMNAQEYHAFKSTAMQYVLEAHQRLQEKFDIILVEGAGSPAEINLRDNDIANMGFAEAVDCPVLLVADIDRGGVFASLYGTLALLSESEQQRIQGLIINRFRGDVSLLTSGIDWLEQKTQKPVLGVVPYLKDLYLEAEDSLNINMQMPSLESTADQTKLKIIVPRFPHLSNHTDFDALQYHPQVNFQYVPIDVNYIPAADLIILPGSKNVQYDLQSLMHSAWQDHIYQHVRYGGKIIGICGGYQMLGISITDLDGIDGWKGCRDGLGLLGIETRFHTQKTLKKRNGFMQLDKSLVAVSGYEIHSGVSSVDLHTPLIYYPPRNPAGDIVSHAFDDKGQLDIGSRRYSRFLSGEEAEIYIDGAISDNERVIGTYLHGIFDQTEACNRFLKWAGLKMPKTQSHWQRQETGINQLANCLENCLDMQTVFDLVDKKR
jgi:adenosylcobyric acid synthase